MIQQVQLTILASLKNFRRRLDHSLSEILIEYSRSLIKKWILEGRVSVNGIIIDKPKKYIFGGEHVLINIEVINKAQNWIMQNIGLDIIYEDNYIIIINKPSNFVVHPGAGNRDGTVLNALLYYCPLLINIPRAGIVHRLDKDTTGLMLIAKTIPVQKYLITKLKLHEIVREYEAIVIGAMTAGGKIVAPLARHPTKRTCMAVNDLGKNAITHYYIIENFYAYTHLNIRLETGRTHQIRVHMAYINHPILGDPLYGRRQRLTKQKTTNKVIENLRSFNRQALHAKKLSLIHPITGIRMEWHAPLPVDMNNIINLLKFEERYNLKLGNR